MSERAVAEAWLEDLASALSDMPEARRSDIVEETRAHLVGRMTAGLSAEQALHGFGTAEEYARAFVDDFTVTHALESRSTAGMVRALARIAGRSLRSLLALLAISICTVTAGVVLVVAANQIASGTPGRFEYAVANLPADALHPAQHTVSFGSAAAGDTRVIDLGFWFFPLALIALLALWFLGRFGLLMAVRSLKR